MREGASRSKRGLAGAVWLAAVVTLVAEAFILQGLVGPPVRRYPVVARQAS